MKLVSATPVYNVDKEAIQMNLATFFGDENMKSITFSEYDINFHLERTFKYAKGKDIVKSFYITHKGLNLGKMNVVYSTSLIEEQVSQIQDQIILFSFTGILILSLIIILIVNRLMQPVNDLTAAASDIAAGNLDRKIDTNSSGEVGELAANFAVMRDAIKEKIDDLARINESLEDEIRLKEANEVKILRQSRVITSVNQFIQQTMQAGSYEEIARVFVPIMLKVVPADYCFVGGIKKDYPDNMDLLAVSDRVSSECSLDGMDQLILTAQQEIAGIRKQVVEQDKTIMVKGARCIELMVNVPESRLSIESMLAIPMKVGQELIGMVFIGSDHDKGFGQEDQEAAETLALALVESLCLIQREIEKKELEEMMIHSEKMISIGGLAAGMAHEINNPLAGILQNSQVIFGRLKDPLPANLKAAEKIDISFDKLNQYMEERHIYKLLDLVLDAGKRAAEIVANMLSFSRKSNSGFLHEDIAQLMEKTLKLAESDYSLKKKFDFKQIKVVRHYEDNLPRVRCKASEIQQVFFNLLSNGAQAMIDMNETESAQFDLGISRHGNMIRIEIKDNGPGMADHVKKKVFEPFFTTKTVGEGTGLGLSVSYFIIVENHKGSIDVVSAPGQGTVFTILLPLA